MNYSITDIKNMTGVPRRRIRKWIDLGILFCYRMDQEDDVEIPSVVWESFRETNSRLIADSATQLPHNERILRNPT